MKPAGAGTIIGLLVVAFAVWLAWVIGSPGKRLYERPAAYGDQRHD